MRAILLAAAGAVLLSPAAAMAAPAAAASPVTSDALCLLTFAALTSQGDENQQQSARIAVGYFAGRIKAHEPGFDFNTRLKPLTAGLDGPHLQAELQRCAPIVQASMTQLETAFRALAPAQPPAGAAPAPKK
jgi:hypothetical protein